MIREWEISVHLKISRGQNDMGGGAKMNPGGKMIRDMGK